MVLQNEADGHESKFIGKIVRVMEDKLRRIPLSLEPYLVGIDSRAKDINLWLQDGSTDVGILLVHGMRGIGKSTIAKFVYNSNFQRFERRSFLENIREVSEQSNGLLRLQKQLLHDLLNGKKVKVHGISEGIAKVEHAVSSKRVLLVLDDVDHVEQLAALLRMQNRFHPGRFWGNSESLALFSWHAFGQDYPFQSYKDHSNRVVHHCAGLPLALKVIGSSLSGKSIAVWESALNKLEAIPNGEILKKLKISYDSLQDDHDRNLFLHFACFFIGMEKDVILRILDDCDFFTEVGIQNLIDRCLVTIDEYNKQVYMHGMIRDMGREIVRLESKEPGERSRLWHHKDSFKVLTENNGTRTIEGLVLNMQMHPAYTPSRNSSKVVLETDSFTRMHKLRLLQLSHIQLSGSYKEFPTGLRWMCWLKFPLPSLPSDFPLVRLVVLEMCHSSLRQVWTGTKYLPSMKVLNLSHSYDLTETPDFASIPNLERLILKDCASLVDFHESIGILRRLVCFNVEDCKSIRKLPKNISLLFLLETLIISGCSSLNEFPVDMSKMESLKVFEADGVPIHRLLTTTREVELWSRPNLGISWASNLPRNLVTIRLRNCNLSEDDFPKDLGNLSSLQTLDLDGNPICSLPEGIRGIIGLEYLSVECCTRLKSLVRLPKIRHLTILDCTSLEKITYESYWCALLSARSNYNLVDQQHSHKLEPIERVDEELINLLGLTELESLGTIMMGCAKWYIRQWEGLHPVQGLYQRGIFSTFIPGNEVPGQFSHTSKGFSVSFIVPLLPQLNTRGLNVFSVLAKANNNDSDPVISAINIDGSDHPIITVVSNEKKGLNWIYGPTFYGVPVDGKDVIWLSHWKFGTRYLEGGDKVTISILTTSEYKVMECGIHLVYHEDEEKIISAQLNPADNPFYPDLVEAIPGTYLLFSYDFWYLHRLPWLNDFIRQFCKYEYKLDNNGDPSFVNSDEIKVDKKEGQQGDNTLAEQSGSVWKVLIIALVFFLSVFPLVFALKSFMFQREKQQATILIPT
ncbi:hypothetical protein M0R45_010047 [Rubus argutus]|uniref:NB-ARC domain-containing protein n=1 Tax=Rubus argutus TaxID=59490 RepID=A0AAW1Y6U7_RUBAR